MFEVILNNVLLAYNFIKNKMDSISLLCKRIINACVATNNRAY